MKELFVPILYDRKALSSTQYASALQGIRNAASRYGQRLQIIAAEDMDSTDFNELPDFGEIIWGDEDGDDIGCIVQPAFFEFPRTWGD